MKTLLTKKISQLEIKAGLFLNLGLVLILGSIAILGSSQDFFSQKNEYFFYLSNAQGLLNGAKVVVAGVPAGRVNSLSFDSKIGSVKVGFQVSHSFTSAIRSDSSVEVLTEGVLGDRIVSILPGSPSKPELQNRSILPSHPPTRFDELISKGDDLLTSLNHLVSDVDRLTEGLGTPQMRKEFSQNLFSTMKHLESLTSKIDQSIETRTLRASLNHAEQLLEKMNHGSGTFSSLVNDPAIYNDLKSIFGQINRNRILRNLIRQTIHDAEPQKRS